ASKEENARSKNKIRFCYEFGEDISENTSEAFKYYMKLAKIGNCLGL
ncbi:31452_t:CDS:1, partial [Racocetra persica]